MRAAPWWKKPVKRLGRGVKVLMRVVLYGALRLGAPAQVAGAAGETGPAPADVRSILVVRPNLRLGNALISTPLLFALRQRFPAARLDYLGGPAARAVLRGLPADGIVAVTRPDLVRPWRLWRLARRLRAARYDLAVDAGAGSVSGILCTWFTGARWRLGATPDAARLYNVMASMAGVRHAYDEPGAIAVALGASGPDRPRWHVDPAEAAAAADLLATLGLAAAGGARPFVALLPGGHMAKRWETAHWIGLAQRLGDAGIGYLVLIGPDEQDLLPQFRAALGDGAPVLPPRPLREFAALLAAARVVVAPDTGPMHLAVAVDAPVLAVIQSDVSRFYLPRGPQDRLLIRPDDAAVFAMVSAHPALVAVRPGEGA
jgi:heptosyltransferase-3